MNLLSILFGKKDTKLTINDSQLKEKYSKYCIESVNNREYLEWFFDVKNNNVGKPMKIIPNCSHCVSEFHCVVGVHTHNYRRAIDLGIITPEPQDAKPQKTDTASSHQVKDNV